MTTTQRYTSLVAIVALVKIESTYSVCDVGVGVCEYSHIAIQPAAQQQQQQQQQHVLMKRPFK